MDLDRKRRELLTAALKMAAHNIYDEDHPDDPAGAWQAELDDEVLLDAARAYALAADPGETTEEWRVWRRQPDGSLTGMGAHYHPNTVEPFLAHPERWVVKRREVHTWKGAYADVSGQPEDAEPVPLAEHPDVTAYLAECKAAGEAPEHDGSPS